MGTVSCGGDELGGAVARSKGLGVPSSCSYSFICMDMQKNQSLKEVYKNGSHDRLGPWEMCGGRVVMPHGGWQWDRLGIDFCTYLSSWVTWKQEPSNSSLPADQERFWTQILFSPPHISLDEPFSSSL